MTPTLLTQTVQPSTGQSEGSLAVAPSSSPGTPRPTLSWNLPNVQLRRGQKPVPFSQTRWLIMGTYKSGKSSTACSFPDSFVFDFEDKIQFVPPDSVKAVDWAVPRTITEIDAIMGQLESEKRRYGDSYPVKQLVFDTAGEWLYNVVIPSLTTVHITPDEQKKGSDITDFRASAKGSKGWNMVTQTVLRTLARAKTAGFGWVVTCHFKETTQSRKTATGTEEITVLRPAINPAAYGGLFGAAEFLAKTSLRDVTTPGVRTTEVVNGRTVTSKTPDTSVLRCVIELQGKPGDSSELVGSNVTLPKELVLEMGRQGEQLRDAYNAAIGR